MEANKLSKLTVSFNGEDDDGSFDSYIGMESIHTINFVETQEKMRKATVAVGLPGRRLPISISNLVLEMSQHIEETTQHGVDWCNNDGGCGSVEWILDGTGEDGHTYKRGICFTVSRRVVELDTSHFSIEGVQDTDIGEDAST